MRLAYSNFRAFAALLLNDRITGVVAKTTAAEPK